VVTAAKFSTVLISISIFFHFFITLELKDKLEILFEDNHLIAINKRAGQLAQGDRTEDISLDQLVKQYIKKKYGKPGDVFLGVIHRLDRPVSGVILYARTSKALLRMNQQFKEQKIKKNYWCIIKDRPQPEEGTLNHYLVKNEDQNKSYAYNEPRPDTKPASLDYRLISSSDRYHLLEVMLHTGRHHQIRCQFAKIGLPIRGDLKYGYHRTNKDASISLHARSLEFIHPVRNDRVRILAPVPSDPLWKAMTAQFD
jgi:23S rRNA pseudouridine1911/1915/1917 synthase